MVNIIIMLAALPGLHFDLQRCMYLHGLKNMVENAKFRQSYDEGDKGRKGALGMKGARGRRGRSTKGAKETEGTKGNRGRRG